ncbi:hypothetical protein MCOR11_003216 [Pyricularia oryzae]|nr:hypothetical protein MCOR11_003216 [Pyricularia oryzae]
MDSLQRPKKKKKKTSFLLQPSLKTENKRAKIQKESSQRLQCQIIVSTRKSVARALPLSGVACALGNGAGRILKATSQVCDAVTEGSADAARDTVDRLADTTARSADDAADGVGQARDCVTEDASEELSTASSTVVV